MGRDGVVFWVGTEDRRRKTEVVLGMLNWEWGRCIVPCIFLHANSSDIFVFLFSSFIYLCYWHMDLGDYIAGCGYGDVAVQRPY